MSGHRQAAVALYSLAEIDQGAILAELPADDQRILRGYLAELAELGFDKAANHADIAVASAPARAALPDARTALRRAPAASMLVLLQHEPASLIAQVLSLEPFAWAPAFMELLAPHRRALVREALNAAFATAPARERLLLDSLGAALRDLPVPIAEPARRGLPFVFSRLLPWTR